MLITSAESRIMQVLWDRGACDAEEVTAALAGEAGWTEATVRTLLSRLMRKKAVAREKQGRRFLFRPLMEQADYAHTESKSLIDRLFAGRPGAMFAQFAAREPLTPEDIAEIKALIARIEDGR